MQTESGDLQALAPLIAAALGEGFTVEPPGDEPRHYVQLVHADGRAFSLNSTWNGHGKLYVSGRYPRDEHRTYSSPRDLGVIRYNEQPPSINVSATRAPEQIARDIARRFLPAYTRIYGACVAKLAERAAYRATVNGLAGELAALIPGAELRERDGTSSVHFYSERGYGDVTPYAETVNLDLRSVPPALARELAAVIGRHITAEGD